MGGGIPPSDYLFASNSSLKNKAETGLILREKNVIKMLYSSKYY